MDPTEAIRETLLAHPAVEAARPVGSRAGGAPTALSDWDFELLGPDLAQIAAALPGLVERLRPIAHGWDPLGNRRTYMLLLPGPIKVDLILALPHEPAQPWTVSAETLPRIDHHFWDWALWLGAKQLRGDERLVRAELARMQRHLLGPMGWPDSRAPRTVPDAIGAYRESLEQLEARRGVRVDRRLADAVRPAIREALLG